MSDLKQSHFIPQNPHWYQDLPDREATDSTPAKVFGDISHVDEIYLEISRASSKLRGLMTFLGIATILTMTIVLIFFLSLPNIFTEIDWFTFFFPVAISCLFAMGIHGLRLDLTTPRDEPVRFNRKRGKVYVSEFKHTWNPFAHWGAVTKEFDWNTLQAEITKQAGFNGKTYMIRYALVLVSVKPDTNEVVDRILLAGNVPMDNHFSAVWAYIKQYMQNAPIAPLRVPLVDHKVTLWNSIKEWLPYLDFSAHGTSWLHEPWPSRMGIIFLLILFVPLAPLFFIFAICHYIAMRFAPESVWPLEIDVESKSTKI